MPSENEFYDFETEEYVFLLVWVLVKIYVPLDRERMIDIEDRNAFGL